MFKILNFFIINIFKINFNYFFLYLHILQININLYLHNEHNEGFLHS